MCTRYTGTHCYNERDITVMKNVVREVTSIVAGVCSLIYKGLVISNWEGRGATKQENCGSFCPPPPSIVQNLLWPPFKGVETCCTLHPSGWLESQTPTLKLTQTFLCHSFSMAKTFSALHFCRDKDYLPPSHFVGPLPVINDQSLILVQDAWVIVQLWCQSAVWRLAVIPH